MDISNQNNNIVLYGFDILGFEIPTESIIAEKRISINFSKFKDDVDLDKFDGVIIPQGIFEKIDSGYDVFGNPSPVVRIETELLLEREREVFNLLDDKRWVCFLVREIIDLVPRGHGYSKINETDLCKRILNFYKVRRERIDGLTTLSTKTNEFNSYLNEYGVARTVFNLSFEHSDLEKEVLASYGSHIVGLEFSQNLFFLPFHTTKIASPTLIDIAKTVSIAIIDYRQKRKIYFPPWLDNFQFRAEQSIKLQLAEFTEKVEKLNEELIRWKNHKSILTVSGETLRKKIIEILENFFKFNVDTIDDGRDDAKILDENSNILFLIEVKGTKAGIKREHINQVDNNRERNSLPLSIPGILIINSEMSLPGIQKKLDTTVPDEQIKHAKQLNILIIRTIDLLYLMKHLENDAENKKMITRKLFQSGGGWLKANENGYEVLDRYV